MLDLPVIPSGLRASQDSSTETTPGSAATEAPKLRRRLSRTMLRTVGEQGLIREGDRILVAVSGGKDSYTLLDLLWSARKKSPVAFDVLAFHLDQAQPGYDGRPLEEWLRAFGAPFEIIHEDTYSTVKALAGEGETYCAPCSRLRRGIIYGAAERLRANKIALGHHRDDALETLLLNLIFAGRLQAMPARYTTNDGRFEVIRPLIECAEKDIARHAELAGYPIIPCNLCGSQVGLKREAVARLLETIERENPEARTVMLSALKNVRATHLLDPEVAEAWQSAAGKYAPRR
jgi:tRNA 2-thiocytidine biosynthesis protein TtcA